ncbi:MAG TPA: porin, partial [Gammaproteobacteria bacterium]
MTRNLLRSAVAAALFAPLAAQAGVYGIMDGIIEYNDNGKSESWTVDNDKLRFGFNGAEDLGNGMSAFYQYEWAQDNGGALSPTAAGPTATSNDGAQRTR